MLRGLFHCHTLIVEESDAFARSLCVWFRLRLQTHDFHEYRFWGVVEWVVMETSSNSQTTLSFLWFNEKSQSIALDKEP